MSAMLAAAGAASWPMPARAAAGVEQADKVVVVKGERRLYLMRQGQVLKSYRIALGRKPKGTKLHQGDGRTPEGSYVLSGFNPGSRFHRAIRVSYPNAQDRARAEALGVAAGGDIMLHGLAPERRGYGAGHWQFNWTDGCIAVTDREIEEIWRRVEIGTPIEIRP
jgi:murein L,D-transpeptidase YafK